MKRNHQSLQSHKHCYPQWH